MNRHVKKGKTSIGLFTHSYSFLCRDTKQVKKGNMCKAPCGPKNRSFEKVQQREQNDRHTKQFFPEVKLTESSQFLNAMSEESNKKGYLFPKVNNFMQLVKYAFPSFPRPSIRNILHVLI